MYAYFSFIHFSESTLRKKWKYLRDNFSSEYSKRPVSRSGDGADNCHQSKWIYFQPLLFLKDIVAPRVSSGSINSYSLPATPGGKCTEPHQVYIDNAEAEQSLQTSVATESPESTDQFPVTVERVMEETEDGRQVRFTGGAGILPQTPSTFQMTKRKSRQDDHYQRMCDIEERKLQYLCDKQARKRDNEDGDADLMFLKALLPHIRLIPQHLKLRFQRKVQGVIEEFAYGNIQNSSQINVQTESPYQYQSYSTSCSPSPSHSPSPTTSFDSAQQPRRW